MEVLTQLVIGLAVGSAYSLIAVAVVLVFKGTKSLSIAMGEIGAFGLFVGLKWQKEGMPFVGWRPSALVTGLIAIVLGGLLGLLVERLVMRPLVQRPPLDGVIATLGVALFLALMELELFGRAAQFVPSPVGDGRVKVLGATLTAPRIAALISAALVALALFLFLSRTRFGLATRAATSDPTVARLLGVRVNRVYVFAWGVGGALAGLAATLLGPSFGGLTPFAQTQFGLRALAGAVIGGLDNIWGAILGSLLVGVIEAQVAQFIDINGAAEAAVLLLVVGTLLVRPRGLLGATGAG